MQYHDIDYHYTAKKYSIVYKITILYGVIWYHFILFYLILLIILYMDFDPKKNYYDVLGINESATESDIKTAFRKLAMKHHPDKWWDAEQFKKINEAYQVLSDSQKKSQYDSFRQWWWGNFSWFEWEQWWFGGFDFGWVNFDIWWVDLGDLLWWFMWWGMSWWSRRSKSTKGQNLEISITITLKNAYHGFSKDLTYYRYVMDSECKVENCTQCKGSGFVRRMQQTVFGTMQTQAHCNVCDGLGAIYTKNWKPVSDWWLIRKEQSIVVKIPAGIEDDKYITYPGMWNDGVWWWPSGDLYVKIKISEREWYRRKWDDLYIDVDISLIDMVLWWTSMVDHPSGKIEIKIPKWTQTTDILKVSGKGFGTGGIWSKSGNLYISPKIHIPKRLSKEEEKLWSELKKLHKK